MKRAAWLLTIAFPLTACSLIYNLDDYSTETPDEPDGGRSRDGGGSDDGRAPGVDGGSATEAGVDGGDAGPADLCQGAIFCSTFSSDSLTPEWGQAIAYGGGVAPVLGTTAFSPPRGLDLRKPSGPAGGGTVTRNVPRTQTTAIAAELRVRFVSIGDGVSILKLGLGASPGVALSVYPSTLDVLGTNQNGAPVHSPLIPQSIPLNQWVQLRLELYPGNPNTATLLVDGNPVLVKGAIGDAVLGADLTIELGIVYIGENLEEVVYSADDLAIRAL